jgi:outer membrane biogenesis lipoprotein LolB
VTRAFLVASALLLLTACASQGGAPEARGEPWIMNPDKWPAASNDITAEPNL